MTGTIDLNILLPELAKRIERTAYAKADFLRRPSRGYRGMPKEARGVAAHAEDAKADLLRELQEWAEPMAVEQGERTTIKALQERLSTMISDWEPWYGYSPDYLRSQRVTGLGVQLAAVVVDETDDTLVGRSSEHHLDDANCFLIGDPEAFDELSVLAEFL